MSHSTVEAEIIATDHAIRISGLPALPLWETILDRTLSLDVYQDNQATARSMNYGSCPYVASYKTYFFVFLYLGSVKECWVLTLPFTSVCRKSRQQTYSLSTL